MHVPLVQDYYFYNLLVPEGISFLTSPSNLKLGLLIEHSLSEISPVAGIKDKRHMAKEGHSPTPRGLSGNCPATFGNYGASGTYLFTLIFDDVDDREVFKGIPTTKLPSYFFLVTYHKAMMARLPLALAVASTLVHVASAQLQVLSPGGDNLWWVADNENLLVWNCNESQEQTFTVLVDNPNMASALAIIAEQPNYVCSLLVTKDQMGGLPVGTGYVVQLANPLNGTDVYAQSSAFEIKAAGSAYPSTTVSPESATFTPSSSGSSSSATTTSSDSTSSSSNDGFGVKASMSAVVVGAIMGMFML
ncbi:hypothetical protein F5877DRAFT_72426 [Lentinula edodes]|nr:hypothetical protein F5877DRAFT_72426 [Lentinula edodes]